MIKTILNLNRAGINRTATRTALHFKYEPDISADIYGKHHATQSLLLSGSLFMHYMYSIGGGEQKKMNMCQAICSAHDVQLGTDFIT